MTNPACEATNSDVEKLIADASEVMRLVHCMLEDYREDNFGDARRWMRHINDKTLEFEGNYNSPPYEAIHGMMQLSNELAEMKRKSAELELKLANPVLLPKTNGYWTEQEKAYEDAITLAKRQVRLAGFRCVGDE